MSTKTLFLLRHAKAIADGGSMTDEDRPLSEKGIKDSKKLASKLHKRAYNFDLILTSPAIRTITTAQLVANRLGYKQKLIAVDKHIYLATLENLLTVIVSVHKKVDSLLLVGHNPSISSLAWYLAGEPISMPTCALLELKFEIKNWEQINANTLIKLTLLN